MERYKIANLIVDIEANCQRLLRLGVPYRSDETGPADITFTLTDEKVKELEKEYPNLSADELAYLATGSLFHRKLLRFNGLMLHASAVAVDGRAYLFSAPSGTGKSTHVGLWKKHFGEKAIILNDDKPIIRRIGENYKVFGTPWSGKTDLNQNQSADLTAIVFLERAENNSISPLNPQNAVTLFLEQTVRPKTPELLSLMLSTADTILSSTPIFMLRCNMSDDAVLTSYNTLKNL